MKQDIFKKYGKELKKAYVIYKQYKAVKELRLK